MEKKKLNLKKVKLAKLTKTTLSTNQLKEINGGDACAYSVVTIDTVGGTPTTMSPSITSCCVTGSGGDENTCNTRES